MPGTVEGISLLSQGTGYGVLIGLGVAFALVILVAVKLQKDYLSEDSGKSEMFMVANRSVGTGLTCSAVFSSWMWINETVYSSVQAYFYGVSAPVWFGSGLAFQISLMAVLGVVVKIRVPHAHTSLEIVRIRYGRAGHCTFIILNLINNIVGCAMMIVTGSQLLVGLTGINLAAATVLIPIGVVLYTAVGGLKATFLTDFLHTTIALILIIYFTLSVVTNEHVGGLGGLYDKVVATSADNYVPGNYDGSLLSFKSEGAIMFGLILKIGNLALVVMDTAFWQKSFASEVKAVVPGYNLAALAIFAVPWALGTVMGLTARCLQRTPVFPFLDNGFSSDQVASGYVMPYVIYALLGSGASVGMLLLLFMAVTSTVSSSMIAVSSIISYDLYRTYINPKATDRQTVRVSHWGVVFHGVFITGITLALNYGGANINWLSYTLNIIRCPGIIPLILTILWSRQSKLAAILSPVLGLTSGLAVWLGTTKSLYGEITMTTTSAAAPCLYGGLVALFFPAITSVAFSYLGPREVFDWRDFLRIGLVGEGVQSDEQGSQSVGDTPTALEELDEKSFQQTKVDPLSNAPETPSPSGGSATSSVSDPRVHPFDSATIAYLKRWYKFSWIFLITIIGETWIAWPLPLYRDWIFSKSFFVGWVTVAILWQFFALGAVVIYPVYDGRRAIAKTIGGLWREYFVRGE